jgi:putative ABC transport system ATP-binding protein
MIAVDGLVFRWPGAMQDCLDIAELRVGPGETLFLHGPSGSGKSTLLGLLAGVLLPTRGTVALCGTSWASLSGSRRDGFRADHVGYVFQQFNLLPYLSAIENVMLPCRFSTARRGRALEANASLRACAAGLLERVAIARSLWSRPASMLSVGQQQRVAAARALIGSPQVVIADEPTSALDNALRDSFVDLLLGTSREARAALVFVSHDDRLAGRFDARLALGAINRAPADASTDEAAA